MPLDGISCGPLAASTPGSPGWASLRTIHSDGHRGTRRWPVCRSRAVCLSLRMPRSPQHVLAGQEVALLQPGIDQGGQGRPSGGHRGQSGRLGGPKGGRRPPPDPVGHLGQRAPDDLGLDPGVHGPLRHRPALRSAGDADGPGLDPELQRSPQDRAPSPVGDHRSRRAAGRAGRHPPALECRSSPRRNRIRHPERRARRTGAAIRKAREAGLEAARLRRLAYHRNKTQQHPDRGPENVV